MFNGIFTLINKATRAYKTVRISTVKGGKLKGERIIGVLIGPQNTSDYLGVGTLTKEGGVRIWKAYKGTKHAEVAEFAVKTLATGHPGVEVEECRFCLRCNRPLTTPQSIELGIGPECATKV